MADLYGRLEALAVAYQNERTDLESDDLTTLVVRAIMALCAQRSERAMFPAQANDHYLRMADLIPVVQALADHVSLADRNVNPQRLGRVLASLRVARGPRVHGRQARQWQVTRADLERWAVSYGIRLPGGEHDF